MKKEIKGVNKKAVVLSLVLLSLILLNLIAVSAPDEGPTVDVGKGVSTIAGTFSSFFDSTSWENGGYTANVAKIFFFFIIAIVVYLVIGGIFGDKSQWLMFILSLLISFLATAYLTPAEVYSVLNSYSALGLTITTLIPLAVIMGLSYRAATAESGQTQLIMLQAFAWILFAVYSIYRFTYDFFYAKEGSGAVNGIILATAVIACLAALFNKQMIKILTKKYIESSNQAAQETIDMGTDFLRNAARGQRRLGGGNR